MLCHLTNIDFMMSSSYNPLTFAVEEKSCHLLLCKVVSVWLTFFFFFFWIWGCSGALHSGFLRFLWDAKDQIRFGHMQGKHPPYYSIALVLPPYFNSLHIAVNCQSIKTGNPDPDCLENSTCLIVMRRNNSESSECQGYRADVRSQQVPSTLVQFGFKQGKHPTHCIIALAQPRYYLLFNLVSPQMIK